MWNEGLSITDRPVRTSSRRGRSGAGQATRKSRRRGSRARKASPTTDELIKQFCFPGYEEAAEEEHRASMQDVPTQFNFEFPSYSQHLRQQQQSGGVGAAVVKPAEKPATTENDPFSDDVDEGNEENIPPVQQCTHPHILYIPKQNALPSNTHPLGVK